MKTVISHTHTHTNTLRCYLLLQRHAILLLKAFALADQAALLSEDGGSRGHFVGGAALAAAATHRPHLLLITAYAVRTAHKTAVCLRLAHIL